MASKGLTRPAEIDNHFCMRGRVLTYQKCPMCQKPFTVLPNEAGIICLDHKTVPTRFYINGNQLGAGRIYSDTLGNPFDSFRGTLRQLETMRHDFDGKKFNADDWIPGKVESYRVENLIAEWLRGYDIEVKGGAKCAAYVKKLKQHVRDYVNPQFEKLNIKDIREPQIRAFYHDLLEKGLATKTIKHILSTLRGFLSAHKSIIKLVPDIPVFTVIPKRDKKWIGIEKQYAGLARIPQEKDRLAMELLFDTGMRPGELRAIKIGDLRDGGITVSRAFSENTLRLITKTGSVETHRLSFTLWGKLIEHTKNLPADSYIFTDNGKPYTSRRLYRIWKKACKKAGIEYITLYQATRHSAVSQIMQTRQLEALNEAAKKLGHTNRHTTKQHYVLDGSKEV